MWYSTSQCLILSLVCSVYATNSLRPNNAIANKRQEMGPMAEEMGMPMPPMPEMAMPAEGPASNKTMPMAPAKGQMTAAITMPAASAPAEQMAAGVMMPEGAVGTGNVAGLKPAAIIKTNDVAGGLMAAATGGASVNSANATAKATASEPKSTIAAATGAKGNTTQKASAASVPAGAAGATNGVAKGTLAAIMRTTISGVKNTYYTAPATTPTPAAAPALAVQGAALTTPNIVKAQASGAALSSGVGGNTTGMAVNSAEHGSSTGNLMFSGFVTFVIAVWLL